MSGNPADKLYACLNYRIRKGSSEYERHPLYFEACREWYETLGEDWQDFITYVHRRLEQVGRGPRQEMGGQAAARPEVSALKK